MRHRYLKGKISMVLAIALAVPLIGCGKGKPLIFHKREEAPVDAAIGAEDDAADDVLSENGAGEQSDPLQDIIDGWSLTESDCYTGHFDDGSVSIDSWYFNDGPTHYAYHERHGGDGAAYQIEYKSPKREYAYAADVSGASCALMPESLSPVGGEAVHKSDVAVISSPGPDEHDGTYVLAVGTDAGQDVYTVEDGTVASLSSNFGVQTFDDYYGTLLPTDYAANMGDGADRDIIAKMRMFTDPDIYYGGVDSDEDTWYPPYAFSGHVSADYVHPELERDYWEPIMADQLSFMTMENHFDIAVPCAYVFSFDDSNEDLVDIWCCLGGCNYVADGTSLLSDSCGYEFTHVILEKGKSGMYSTLVNEYADTDEELEGMCAAYGKDPTGWIIDDKMMDALQGQALRDYLSMNEDCMPFRAASYEDLFGNMIDL